jgi:hypothetical protein
MSWTRYLFHDYFTAKELNRIDAAAERRRRITSSERTDLRRLCSELEDDLGRLALLVHALAEVCVRKGVLTREEITAMMAEVDMLDGVADGKLDPNALRPKDERPKRPARPEDFFRDLESRGG